MGLTFWSLTWPFFRSSSKLTPPYRPFFGSGSILTPPHCFISLFWLLLFHWFLRWFFPTVCLPLLPSISSTFFFFLSPTSCVGTMDRISRPTGSSARMDQTSKGPWGSEAVKANVINTSSGPTEEGVDNCKRKLPKELNVWAFADKPTHQQVVCSGFSNNCMLKFITSY